MFNLVENMELIKLVTNIEDTNLIVFAYCCFRRNDTDDALNYFLEFLIQKYGQHEEIMKKDFTHIVPKKLITTDISNQPQQSNSPAVVQNFEYVPPVNIQSDNLSNIRPIGISNTAASYFGNNFYQNFPKPKSLVQSEIKYTVPGIFAKENQEKAIDLQYEDKYKINFYLDSEDYLLKVLSHVLYRNISSKTLSSSLKHIKTRKCLHPYHFTYLLDVIQKKISTGNHYIKNLRPLYLHLVQSIKNTHIREYIENKISSPMIESKTTIIQIQNKPGGYECEICYDEFELSNMMQCGNHHYFCNLCYKNHLNVLLSEGNTKLKCIDKHCDYIFTFNQIEKIIDAKTLQFYTKSVQMEEIRLSGLEVVSCPFCSFSFVLDGKMEFVDCQNQNCLKLFCLKCNKEAHPEVSCENLTRYDTLKKFMETKMDEIMIRQCNRCKLNYIKVEACNHIKCKDCSAEMCYVCGAAIQGYKHFDKGGCPLYTSNEIVNEGKAIDSLKSFVNERQKEHPEETDMLSKIYQEITTRIYKK